MDYGEYILSTLSPRPYIALSTTTSDDGKNEEIPVNYALYYSLPEPLTFITNKNNVNIFLMHKPPKIKFVVTWVNVPKITTSYTSDYARYTYSSAVPGIKIYIEDKYCGYYTSDIHRISYSFGEETYYAIVPRVPKKYSEIKISNNNIIEENYSISYAYPNSPSAADSLPQGYCCIVGCSGERISSNTVTNISEDARLYGSYRRAYTNRPAEIMRSLNNFNINSTEENNRYNSEFCYYGDGLTIDIWRTMTEALTYLYGFLGKDKFQDNIIFEVEQS